ncbi:hypothetical protein EDB99_1187 [Pseudomonas sp. 460]|nr:hypothetical protein EDB99_1187 [Pseudomonas sp. 460]
MTDSSPPYSFTPTSSTELPHGWSEVGVDLTPEAQ